MKKKGALFRLTVLLLISTIILSFSALSVSANVLDTAPCPTDSSYSGDVVRTGWGSTGDTDAEEPDETVSGAEVLVIILVSMSIVAFGALAFKLFGNTISNKELVILLIVLILVVIAAALALYIILVERFTDVSTASAYIKNNILGEGNYI